MCVDQTTHTDCFPSCVFFLVPSLASFLTGFLTFFFNSSSLTFFISSSWSFSCCSLSVFSISLRQAPAHKIKKCNQFFIWMACHVVYIQGYIQYIQGSLNICRSSLRVCALGKKGSGGLCQPLPAYTCVSFVSTSLCISPWVSPFLPLVEHHTPPHPDLVTSSPPWNPSVFVEPLRGHVQDTFANLVMVNQKHCWRYLISGGSYEYWHIWCSYPSQPFSICPELSAQRKSRTSWLRRCVCVCWWPWEPLAGSLPPDACTQSPSHKWLCHGNSRVAVKRNT